MHRVWKIVFLSENRFTEYSIISEFKARIHPNAIIASTNSAGGILGNTRHLQSLDHPARKYLDKPDYVFISKADLDERTTKVYLQLIEDGYQVLIDREQVIILVK